MLILNILTKITEFIVIILAGLIIGRILGKITKKILFEFKFKTELKIHRIGENIVKYFVYITAVIFALKRSGISNIIGILLTILFIILIILFLFLKTSEIIPNLISSFYVKKNYKIGDKINIENIIGKIEKIKLTETKIKSNEDIFFVPNSLIKKLS